MSPLTTSEGAAAVGGVRGGSPSGMLVVIWLGQFVEHLLGVGDCSTTNPRCHQGEILKLTRVED
jgi:hypothetical protein